MGQTDNQTGIIPGAGSYREVLKRFYLPMGFAVTVAVLTMVGSVIDQLDGFTARRLGFVAATGFFITLGCRLHAENRGWSAHQYLALSAASVAILAGLVFAVEPIYPSIEHGVRMTVPSFLDSRLITLGIASLLLALTAPFLGLPHKNEQLWFHCFTFFQSAVFSVVVTLLIGLGLLWTFVAWMMSIKLFSTELIPVILIFSLVVFYLPARFLLGLPPHLPEGPFVGTHRWFRDAIDHAVAPVALVSAASTAVLLLVLPFIWDQIRDGLATMASVLGCATVAAWFAATPFRETGNAATRLFFRGFPIFLLLQAGLIAAVTVARLAEGGMTEYRYVHLLLSVWLGGLALYHLFPTRRRLIAAPLSLAILLILSTIGPWSASNVATRSKLAQLETLLTENRMIAARQVIPADDKLDRATAQQINDSITYFYKWRKQETLTEWFAARGIKPEESGMWPLMNAVNVPYTPLFSFDSSYNGPYPTLAATLADSAYLVDIRAGPNLPSRYSGAEQRFGGQTAPLVTVNFETNIVTVLVDEEENIRFDLSPTILAIHREDPNGHLPRRQRTKLMTLTASSGSGRFQAGLYIKEVTGNIWREEIELGHMQAFVLVWDREAPR